MKTGISVFVGRYDVAVDKAGAFTVPQEWRDPFADGREAFLMPDAQQRCLLLIAKPTMEAEARALLREIGEKAVTVAVERSGRMTIPADLRIHVQIERVAALVGDIRFVKIWDPEALRTDEMSVESLRKALMG